ncbi:uncharacterized protein LOC108201810 isoform X3 [Daucus carota subsp. sativus]|uniref:uncharacterized protein LOC108201810 isoform X3 n=1 Tax=Daucus carota subsp. sativus TaxID=79200 RepID=UPI0007F01418|nr:PREDICTED: uncharacterized protein LOC108201810 isoform X2 [Daucus carota subsp. sativus]
MGDSYMEFFQFTNRYKLMIMSSRRYLARSLYLAVARQCMLKFEYPGIGLLGGLHTVFEPLRIAATLGVLGSVIFLAKSTPDSI